MERLDIQYKRMGERCKIYHNEIENLKNYVYGYNAFLDCIVPFESESVFYESSNALGLNAFCEKMYQYYLEFTGETHDVFGDKMSDTDKEHLFSIIKCIVYFLKTECNKSDYTFLGFIKILKTFLVEYKKGYNPTYADSTFWHMFDESKSLESESCPEEIKKSFGVIFGDYKHEYTKTLADGLYTCIRFFLYENRLDYINDPIMFNVTIELIREIENRLSVIFDNRMPKKEEGYRYE